MALPEVESIYGCHNYAMKAKSCAGCVYGGTSAAFFSAITILNVNMNHSIGVLRSTGHC